MLIDEFIIDEYNKGIISYTELSKRIKEEFPEEDRSIRTLRRYVSEVIRSYYELDKEHSAKIGLQLQRLQDKNRIARKIVRDNNRQINAILEYNQALQDVFKKYDVTKFIKPKIKHKVVKGTYGVIHFSDAHFNELISTKENQYDFSIAAKRCEKLIDKAVHLFKSLGVEKVIFISTGDLINSDRRLDELLSMATNRSKATFLAVEIIQQMIIQLANNFGSVDVASVIGNESRVQLDITWSDIAATDNYDFTIFQILKLLFKENKYVTFLNNNQVEDVIQVGNKNFLILHGHQKVSNLSGVIAKYNQQGTIIDFVLLGHEHNTNISDFWARSSSLSGGNAYSKGSLQLPSKAAQNLHVVHGDDLYSIKIDLQNVDGYGGYNIHEKLIEYKTNKVVG